MNNYLIFKTKFMKKSLKKLSLSIQTINALKQNQLNGGRVFTTKHTEQIRCSVIAIQCEEAATIGC